MTCDARAESDRCREVRRLFDLGRRRPPAFAALDDGGALPLPRPGEIALLGGPSGGGKSTLLRRLASRWHGPVVDVQQTPLPDCAAVDVPGLPLERALPLLARLGLAEAWLLLTPATRLSEGQRLRLRLAAALASAPPGALLLCDEFASVLDRVTAAAVARGLCRAIRRADPAAVAALLATAHEDLHEALRPDHVAWCDFGVIRRAAAAPRTDPTPRTPRGSRRPPPAPSGDAARARRNGASRTSGSCAC